jgi:RND family efflux transporter MFP subunit
MNSFLLPIMKYLCFFLLPLLLVACGKPPAEGGHGAFPPPAVTVAQPTVKEIQEWDEFTGRTEAVESVEIRPRVSGYIDEVHFKSGQLVKKGQLLFSIDPRPFQAALEQVDAEVQRAKTKLEFAKKELERSQKLIASKAISAEEADGKSMMFREAGDALRSAEAGLKAAALDVEFCSVRSPIEGRVSRDMVTAGNYVSGNAGMTTLLTTVVTTDLLYVYADVDEATFQRYQRLSSEGKATHLTTKETVAEMKLEGEKDYVNKGKVESFDNRISGTTGSILVRAVFDNKGDALRPGAFVRLRLPAGPVQQSMLISEEGIGTDQGTKFVLTVGADNMTNYKPVQVGPLLGGMRVLRGGVAAEDKIIINGLAKVRPGMPVTPMTGEASPPKGAP